MQEKDYTSRISTFTKE